MNVSITGGSGFIGGLLTASLVARGDQITLLSRRESTPTSNIKVVKGDIVSDVAALGDFVRDAEVIIHCAGEVNDTELMYRLHVDGTRNLLAALHRQIKLTGTPVHWVQLSSTGAYGPRESGSNETLTIDERFTPAPVGTYEVTKTISDELVVALAAVEPLFTFTIVRPSIVIGSGMSNQSFFQMGEVVRKRLFFYIGSDTSLATYVHVDDVIRALLLCTSDVRAVGKTFILSNDCPLEQVISQLARAQAVPVPRLRLPESLIRLLVKVISPLVRLPLTPERVDALTKHVGYSSVHIRNTLGFEFASSIPESIPGLIANRTKRAT